MTLPNDTQDAAKREVNRLKRLLDEQKYYDDGFRELNSVMLNNNSQTSEEWAYKLLSFLTPYVGAVQATLYLLKDARLKLAAGYSVDDLSKLPSELPLGEGTVGLAAVKRRPVMIDQADKADFRSYGAAARVRVTHLLAEPIIHNDEVIGIAEFAFYKQPDLRNAEFLRRVNASIAANLKIRIDEEKLQSQNTRLQDALTELKDMQAQMVHTEKMASIGQLTAGIAHEINNPVNFVTGGVFTLQHAFEDLMPIIEAYDNLYSLIDSPDELRRAFEEINEMKEEVEFEELVDEIGRVLKAVKEGARRTSEIVKGLKDFSRVDQNTIQTADIHECLEGTLLLLNNQLKDRIEVVKHYDPNLPEIECDAGKLNQVFMNILANAAQAIRVKGTITVDTKALGDKIEIRLGDSGRGMPEDVRKRIFEPFYTTKDVGEGTGLGLSITYSIIQKHKGDIQVESVENEGTTFVITLPVRQDNDAAAKD